jgi:glycosyltransferase involved in cell wall biosynthesis
MPTSPTPTVAILTPVYNGVEYLAECVASVVNQTFTDWQMWIGVNGHSDHDEGGGEVGLLVKAIGALDQRIHVVIQPPTIVGKVAAMNDLFGRSGGFSARASVWIAILDCDDVWHPEKLERQIAATNNGARTAAVIGTQCEYFGTMSGSPQIPVGYVDPRDLKHVNPIINSSALVARSWMPTSLWTGVVNERGLEDYELWMRIVIAGGRLYNIPEVLTRHRIHPASAFNSRGQNVEPLRAWFVEKYKSREGRIP